MAVHLLLLKTSCFVRILLLCLCRIGKKITCLVKSKPDKQEVSRTVILSPMVSFLWSTILASVQQLQLLLANVVGWIEYDYVFCRQQMVVGPSHAYKSCSCFWSIFKVHLVAEETRSLQKIFKTSPLLVLIFRSERVSFLKKVNPRPFSLIFGHFQTNVIILTTN